MGQPSVPVHDDTEMPSGEGQEFCHPTLSFSWPRQSLSKPTSSREISLVLAICQWPFSLGFVDRKAEEDTMLLLHPKVPRHAGFPRGEHRGSRHRFL